MSDRGTLFLVAMPLGNLRDVSTRALDTLRDVDAVFAEDTRSAGKVLKELGIDRKTRSCHDSNEHVRADEIVGLLQTGQSVALMSEAGTPAVSDPGYRVTRAAIDAGARIVPVPGASAPLAALIASGLPTDRFFFAGFAPRKGSARKRWLQSLAAIPSTLVLFESPLRVAATLADLLQTLGDRPACLAREISKTHEEFVRQPLKRLLDQYKDQRPLGEITLVIGGPSEDATMTDSDLLAQAGQLLQAGHSVRDAARLLTEQSGRSRKAVYALVQAARDADGA